MTPDIRKAIEADKDQVWNLIREVISTGDTYSFYPDSSREKMLDFWFGPEKLTYVSVNSEQTAIGLTKRIVGTFFLKPNQPDLGSHVANAGYMVSKDARGKGIGRMMAEFSFGEARRLGFRAMQYNFVVKSNTGAVKLWLDLGFEVIGEIPEAIDHPDNGPTNALIMYRTL